MKGIGFYEEDFFTIKENEALLRENITRILVTSPGEYTMSEFGCRLKEFIFDPEFVLEEDVKNEIRRAINRWEPRVEISEISAEMTNERTASIVLKLINKETLEPFTYEATLRL